MYKIWKFKESIVTSEVNRIFLQRNLIEYVCRASRISDPNKLSDSHHFRNLWPRNLNTEDDISQHLSLKMQKKTTFQFGFNFYTPFQCLAVLHSVRFTLFGIWVGPKVYWRILCLLLAFDIYFKLPKDNCLPTALVLSSVDWQKLFVGWRDTVIFMILDVLCQTNQVPLV